MRADLFCRVIDNLGDIGVSWRLARQLTHEKKWQIRLWVDDLSALQQLEPTLDRTLAQQCLAGVDIRVWPQQWLDTLPGDVVIASFSCELPSPLIERMADGQVPWLQLEYLSAEDWVPGYHLKSSRRADGLQPVFFFPGFTAGTGGLLREAGLLQRRRTWQADVARQRAWLKALDIHQAPDTRLGSVFTYRTAPLNDWVLALAGQPRPTHLLIPEGVPLPDLEPSTAGAVTWQRIPFLPQSEYDHLLWTMDFNLVRGEDSFVRAIWAGRPFVWQAYPQAEGAHHTKIRAFLTQTDLPNPIGDLFHAWSEGQTLPSLATLFSEPIWSCWQNACSALAGQLAQMPDLGTQIDQWCRTATSADRTR